MVAFLERRWGRLTLRSKVPRFKKQRATTIEITYCNDTYKTGYPTAIGCLREYKKSIIKIIFSDLTF